MKKRTFRWSYLFVGLLILILLALLGGWWSFRSQYRTSETPPPSPVLVFLLSPPSGDEMHAGDFVPVTVQAVAPEAIQSAELFVDGQSLGVVTDSPSNPSWTWQAWPLGVHTFSARATTTAGQVGESQSVLVNVLAGDGVMQVFSEDGQTLEQIGAGFGVPPDQMAGANPNVDPSQPLPGGKPVQVPIGSGGAGAGSAPEGGFGPYITIAWTIKITETVDISYCYVSGGNGSWEKMPKEPFNFFLDAENLYTQVTSAVEQVVVQAQCWGWLGGTLKYLGQGQTDFNAQQPPNEVQLNAEGFVLVGIPQVPEAMGGGPNGVVTPPFALREPADDAECTSHGNPLLAPFICDTLLNAPVKEYTILIWEWKPEVCWPGYCKYEINEIDGYMIYQMDPLTQASTYFLKEVDNSNQTVTAIPLPWGAKCYGVTALAGGQESEMVTYCPDISPGVEKLTLKTITSWVTTEDSLSTEGCSLGFQQYSKPGLGLNIIPPGFGNQPGEVFVGAYRYEASGGVLAGSNCYEDAYFNAGVKFDVDTSLPKNAVIHQATLRFFVPFQDYLDFTYMNSPLAGTCVASIRRAKSDWGGLIDSNHWTKGNILQFADFSGSAASVSFSPSPQADVTAMVKGWQADPLSNHGFVMAAVNPPSLDYIGLGLCYTGLKDFQLDIYYFAP